ncbi:hypothetical protein FRC03_012901 [Tulasnella sp. 419]|nr:hypothetical protein FRC03_012901 [Tulasnella sp. 419]
MFAFVAFFVSFSFNLTVSIVIWAASKCLPRLVIEIVSVLVPGLALQCTGNPSARPRRLHRDYKCSSGPVQDSYIRIFYGDSYANPRGQFATPHSSPSGRITAEKIFEDLLPADPVPIAITKSSKRASKNRDDEFLNAKKRDAIRLCSNAGRPSALRATDMSLKEKIVIIKFARYAIREKRLSKVSPEKPFSKDYRHKMAELGEISTLPRLQRFSTSRGLHGPSSLRHGVPKQDGRREGLEGAFKRGPSVPPAVKRPSIVRPEPPLRPISNSKFASRHLLLRPTAPRLTFKPQLVTRTGREDWGRRL